MQTPDFVLALRPICAAFRRLHIEFFIGGSVASSTHGMMRSSADVDVVAALRPEHIDPLIAAIGGEYYVSRTAMSEAVAARRSFNAIHTATMYKVDVFIMGTRPHDHSAMKRAREMAIEEGAVEQFPVASPEDIILAKLAWFRLGDEVSERQWTDIQGIMRVKAATLDRDYLAHGAQELGVADLLERAWRDAS